MSTPKFTPLTRAFGMSGIRRAILASALAVLALSGLAFADSGHKRAGATTTATDALVVSVDCEALDDLINCRLISVRELDLDEGVEFVVTVNGDARTIVATHQTECGDGGDGDGGDGEDEDGDGGDGGDGDGEDEDGDGGDGGDGDGEDEDGDGEDGGSVAGDSVTGEDGGCDAQTETDDADADGDTETAEVDAQTAEVDAQTETGDAEVDADGETGDAEVDA
ncbi:MAG: hypothetical protein OXH78_04855, partial [Acidimicrobiaceae bacterium]|nr:hypothetical protein [Acidimicrobiaceae bacterium]